MIVLAALVLLAQSADSSIGGRVIDRSTQVPLPRVRLILRLSGSDKLIRTAVTNADGQFRFSGIAAGKYSLNAERLGYRPQGYNQNDLAFGFQSAILVGPGEEIEGLIFGMVRSGAIAGRITDSNGDPVRNAQVQSYLILGQGEHRTARRVLRSTTNDLGEYRIQPLAPGTYAVSIAGQPWTRQAGRELGFEEKAPSAYPVTFYPAASDPANAGYLKIQPGQTVQADVSLTAVPTAKLRIVLGAAVTTKKSRPQAVIALAGPLGTNSYHSTYYFGEESEKEILELAPGHYQVWLYEGEKVVGMATFQLVRDATVRVGDQPMATVRGTVALETGTPAGSQLFIRLSHVDGIRGVYSQAVEADGTFSIPSMNAGLYSVAITGGRESVLTALNAKGAGLRDGVLEVPTTGDVELSVSASTKVRRVVGVVRQGKQAISGALVVLAPSDLRDDFALYRFDQSDSDGSFTWYGVLPGNYVAFAFAGGLRSEYDSAAILRRLRSLGQPVTINSAKDEAVNVAITPIAEGTLQDGKQ